MNTTLIHVPRRFVSHEWGGTETVITEISHQQQLAGYSPKIVTSMALAEHSCEQIRGIPVERHRYCYPFLGLSQADKAALDKKGGNLLSLSLFTALLREPNVRLFHAHSLKRLGGSVATAARLKNKPFVVSLHGGVFDVPQAELGSMTQPIQGKLEWGRIFGALFRSRQILHEADLVICVGQSELEAAQQQLPHDRIAYLPNGVDSGKFQRGEGARFRAAHGLPPEAFLVMNISRIDAQKNQHQLVEAFAQLHRAHPAARLVLIGPETQPDYAEQVRATIQAHQLEQAVLLLPGLRHDDPTLLDAFQACDAFVLPSRHEPFGIVALEAWSAGKPVIASRIGGLKQLIREEQNGLFFDVTSEQAVEQLAQQLLRLHDHPELRHQLAENGRAEAVTQYDWQRIHALQEQLYQRAEEHHQRVRTQARVATPPVATALERPAIS